MHDSSYSEYISNFMSWAHDRISKEIALNEECEKEFGSKAYEKEAVRVPQNLSDSEKLSIINNVDKRRDEKPDLTIAGCCEPFRLHVQTYYKWRRDLKLGKYTKK